MDAEAKISFEFSLKNCKHYAKIEIDDMSILLIKEDSRPTGDSLSHYASSTKNNLSIAEEAFSRTSVLAKMLGDDFGLGSPIAVSPLLESPDKSDKRQKSTTKEGKSLIVKKFIKELKYDSVNKGLIFAFQLSEDSYTYLYKEIIKTEADNDITSQKAQSKVDKEVKDQLSKEINDTTH
ncbi:15622_t:CDS:2 [Cetraspora pellucida]|uniref:15622_t:CDS:1 n=1 Tax=Cetraspora pellucida TaxID=1433469 RepID=A0ACA9KHR0_9GLOM|nr:15622_t:CDS:2 [Cetraspora pellucida]